MIALRYVYNACLGDNDAIQDILDRVDGKTAQKILGEGLNSYGNSIVVVQSTAPTVTPTDTVTPTLTVTPTETVTPTPIVPHA